MNSVCSLSAIVLCLAAQAGAGAPIVAQLKFEPFPLLGDDTPIALFEAMSAPSGKLLCEPPVSASVVSKEWVDWSQVLAGNDSSGSKSTIVAAAATFSDSSRRNPTRTWVDWNANGRFEPEEEALKIDNPANDWAVFRPKWLPQVLRKAVVFVAIRDGHIMLVKNGRWVTELPIGGRSVKVAVEDTNSSGTMWPHQEWIYWPTADQIGVDLNGDGKISRWNMRDLALYQNEVLPYGATFEMPDGRFYKLDANLATKTLTATALDLPTGTIDFGDEVVGTVTALNQNGFISAQVHDGVVRLPVGSYAAFAARLIRRDTESHEWFADAILLEDQPVAGIFAGRKTRFSLVRNWSAAVSVSISGDRNCVVRSYVGSDKPVGFLNLSLLNVAAPDGLIGHRTIVSVDGKEIASLPMKPEQLGSFRAEWRIPENLTGTVRFEAEYNLGPFGRAEAAETRKFVDGRETVKPTKR